MTHIVGLMREFKFRRGKTKFELMEKWNLCRQALDLDCAEAQRVIRRELEDPDYVAVNVGEALMKGLFDAIEDADAMRGTKEGLTARTQVERFARTFSDIMGNTAPLQLAIQEAITPERAREIVAERFGKVTPKADKPEPKPRAKKKAPKKSK